MSRLYRLPAQLGGATVPGTPTDDGGVRVAVEGLGNLIIQAALLTEVAMPEPPLGTIALDPDGDAWHHKRQGEWYFGSACCGWDELVKRYVTLSPVGATSSSPAGPTVTVTDRFDLAAPIPASVDAYGDRMLNIGWGKFDGQLVVQVQEGELFSRAAILDLDAAERAGWTLLKAVAEWRAVDGARVNA